jgi:hypothetical protein
MPFVSFALGALALTAAAAVQQAPAPCAGLPPGKHAVLERMTADFGLTCEQQLKAEVILHSEESVSRPLLKFSSFTAEQHQQVMTSIKLAARRQIRPLLNPEQQTKLDRDMDEVAKGAKTGTGKKAAPAPSAAPLDDEEALSAAVMNYDALTASEKQTIVRQVKRAARDDPNLHLTADQQKKLDSEIAALSTGGEQRRFPRHSWAPPLASPHQQCEC